MKKKEKYVKGVMKKSECDIWKEFTYGAWWLPFEKNGSNLAWQKKKKSKWGNSILRYCKKCDRAYEINQFARPRQVYYFSNVPKKQNPKVCPVCEGKNVSVHNY